ncbi:hypothetical protein D9611_010181 [Ephemerocybe angulata]|uniref:Uncharacterized protein n=1 Tax=Ephemerocybe angulata TaxID=980116 RepID=A0A8H5EVK4_9AGAR|nr:hypothetical protein D9611_010181 [Tulosesus angulatus]
MEANASPRPRMWAYEIIRCPSLSGAQHSVGPAEDTFRGLPPHQGIRALGTAYGDEQSSPRIRSRVPHSPGSNLAATRRLLLSSSPRNMWFTRKAVSAARASRASSPAPVAGVPSAEDGEQHRTSCHDTTGLGLGERSANHTATRTLGMGALNVHRKRRPGSIKQTWTPMMGGIFPPKVPTRTTTTVARNMKIPPPRPPTVLAQELVDAVIDAVAGACAYDRRARDTLRQCALVSRTFLPRCQMHLFREVKFVTRYTTPVDESRMGAFLRLLQQRSLSGPGGSTRIAEYVQVLHLRNSAFWEPELPEIVGRLTGLRSIQLQTRPGTSPWDAFTPALRGALVGIMALETLEEVSVQGFSDLPLSLFGRPTNLQRLTIRDCTIEEEEDGAVGDGRLSTRVERARRGRLPEPKRLSIRGSFPFIFPLLRSSTLSLSMLREAEFVTASTNEVEVSAAVLRLSSAVVERLSFCNRIDDALPDIHLAEYPCLQRISLELQVSFHDSRVGLPTSLRNLLRSIEPPSSQIRTLEIRIRWDSCNPDVPWDCNGLKDAWAEVDDLLYQIESLRSVSLLFVVSYNNGKEVWAQDDIMAIEKASQSLDGHLDTLLRRTSSRNDVQARVTRDSW